MTDILIYGDIDECAKDATVTLVGNKESRETKTNGFGDFEFEGLPDNVSYTVKIDAPGYASKSVKAKTLKTFPGDFSSADFQKQVDGEHFYKTKFGRDEMPKFDKKIPDEDIWSMVNYMRTFKK